MKQQKKKKKVIGKVNPILYATVYTALKGSFTKKYGITYDKACVKDMKGPAVVLATHTSDVDHVLSALTLYPVRPTYIVSEHFMHKKATARLLKYMHVITKKMFTPDVSTIMNILRAKRENAVIVIFPEGRLSCYAHSVPVAEGTAELIKKLGVDLYIWKAEGASLTFPKWRDKDDARRGKIRSSVKLLLSADEVKERSVEEIKRISAEAILHDDELAMEGVEYRSETIASGVDRILYKCPVCLRENGITAEKDRIRCTCGLDARLDGFYRLDGAPFRRINEWFEWQQASIDVENEVLTSKARLGCCDAKGFMDGTAGEGEIYLDKHEFRLSGTLYGEPIAFSVDAEKIGAFPITPGDHFDVYHNGRLIYVYPLPDGRTTVKWTSFVDRLNEVRRMERAEAATTRG